MSVADVTNVAVSILLSLGGGGVIVFALSNWLGKLRAERLMSKESAKHNQELAELRATLERANQDEIARLRTALEIYRDKNLKAHGDKLGTYGAVVVVIADLLADLDMFRRGKPPEGDPLVRFDRGRLKAHGYLAMLAPQEVMDTWDALVDYISEIFDAKMKGITQAQWSHIRQLAYDLINTIRDDIGVDKSPIEYRGKR